MKNIRGVLSAAIVTIWTIVVMAIATEIYPAFKAILTSFAGQHWTAKSIVAVAAFGILYVVFRRRGELRHPLAEASVLIASVLLGSALIFLFYFQHYMYS